MSEGETEQFYVKRTLCLQYFGKVDSGVQLLTNVWDNYIVGLSQINSWMAQAEWAEWCQNEKYTITLCY